MILADTSVWIDHLRLGVRRMHVLLEAGEVVQHPFVVGEIALGTLRNRGVVLQSLLDLPQVAIVSVDEAFAFIATHGLFGLGIGYVDVHLLAATRLTPRVRLWTRDRRLHRAAQSVGVAAEFA